MAFKFIHTADIHLDSPLRSLALRNEQLAELIGNATRRALSAIIDLCLEENVDALLIAGDLYDGEQTSMKTARFLASEMQRLHEAKIRVFKIRGNHDALSKITQELVLPDSVHVFGPEATSVEFTCHGHMVAIHGMSFAKPHAPQSLLPKYKPPVAGAINIGMMHTSLAGSEGHDVYAPCHVQDLLDHGFDYWALGHIHQRSQYGETRKVVMPGMPQGRDINENGAKTVSLVTITDDFLVTVEEKCTSLAQFERLSVDLTGVDDWRAAMNVMSQVLERARATTVSPYLVARLKLSGATPLAFRLRRDSDLLLAEAEARAERVGHCFVEKIELQTRPPAASSADGADPVAELERLMDEKIMPELGFQTKIKQMLDELLGDLPADARHFAGEDEVSQQAFLRDLLSDARQLAAARMKPAERGEV